MFRDAEERDLPIILELTAATWALHRTNYPEHFGDAEWANTAAEIQARFGKDTPGGLPAITLVADLNGALVGYVSAVRQSRVDDTSTHDVQAHIDDIAVLPQHRKTGIGRELLEQMRDRLRAEGVTVVTATVWSFNADSIALFQNAGVEARSSLLWQRLSPPVNGRAEPVAPQTDEGKLVGDLVLVAIILTLALFLFLR